MLCVQILPGRLASCIGLLPVFLDRLLSVITRDDSIAQRSDSELSPSLIV